MFAALDATGTAAVVAAVLAVPGFFVAWGQWTDRRERREHRAKVERQLQPSDGMTVAQITEEILGRIKHLEARERRNANRLGRLRATQLEQEQINNESREDMARLAESLGRHLRQSDADRRTLGLPPEGD